TAATVTVAYSQPHNMQPTRNREPGRRDVLGGGVAIIAGVWRSARSGVVAVRRDAAGLRHSPRLLATLEAAIGEMQRRSERDANDPKGWRVHSQAHHAVCAAVANDADDQVHGSWWFLPWHRAYLAVTEWKLQAISGDPTLALPYWNWSSDRTIPSAFSRQSSPLSKA